MKRNLAPVVASGLVILFTGCARQSETRSAGTRAAPEIVASAPALPPEPAAPVPTAPTVTPHADVLPPRTLPLLATGPLVAGTTLTLVPNLPGVEHADLPESSERRVEVVALSRKRVTLRWTGQVRTERPESARAREDWVRARSNARAHATPIPPIEPAYEQKEVGGTLEFPDFGNGRSFLLPALWPEGHAVLKGSSAFWISPEAWRELRSERRSRIPFFRGGRDLKDPAASLLERASDLAAETPRKDSDRKPKDFWRALEPGGRFALTLNGVECEVATLRVQNWFGVYDVLEEEENPLVLSVLPDPPSSTLLDLFAPAGVLKTLLGYRVASIETPRKKLVSRPR